MSGSIVRGSCSCERVLFEVRQPAKWVAHCHCANCRRAHGAGFVTYAGFPGDALTFTQGEEELTPFETQTGATRQFCGHCGSTLTYASPRWEGEIHVIVANLLDPLESLPSAHAYADRAPDWCPITDGLPRFGGESGTKPL